MRRLDNLLQTERLRRAALHIRAGSSILDIGCHQGELDRYLAARRNVRYAGIDPDLVAESERRVKGTFPMDVPPDWAMFDHVVALAVLEHVQRDRLQEFLGAAWSLLRPDGTLIATIPSPLTDKVLDALKAVRLIDGMDLDAHDGLTITELTAEARAVGLQLERHDRFQLGLNNLVIWRRRAGV